MDGDAAEIRTKRVRKQKKRIVRMRSCCCGWGWNAQTCYEREMALFHECIVHTEVSSKIA